MDHSTPAFAGPDFDGAELSEETLQSVSGGTSGGYTINKVCPACKKYGKFLILSKKKAKCKNCGEIIDLNTDSGKMVF